MKQKNTVVFIVITILYQFMIGTYINAAAAIIFNQNFDSLPDLRIMLAPDKNRKVNFIFSEEYDIYLDGTQSPKAELSSDYNHTAGSGKSLKLYNYQAKWNKKYNSGRLKFFNVFKRGNLDASDIGKSFCGSFWVYSEETTSLSASVMSIANTSTMSGENKNAYGGSTYKKGISYNIPAKTWTECIFNYKFDKGNVNEIYQIGIFTIMLPEGTSEKGTVIYIDDISMHRCENKTEKIEAATVSTTGIPNVLSDPAAKRPVPTVFKKSSRIDDLLYFDMPADPDTVFRKISNGTVILKQEAFLQPSSTEGMPDYGSYQIIEVNGMPFKKAIRFTCTVVPEKAWKFNYRVHLPPGFIYEDNDTVLIRAYVRLLSGGDFDTKTGRLGISLGERSHVVKIGTLGRGTAVYTMGEEWITVYLPVKINREAGAAGYYVGINPGYHEQVVEIGGIEFIFYGKKYPVEKLPQSSRGYKGYEVGASWRKEALAKIEHIRKNNITIIVNTADGKPVADADVKIAMYEHEFNFSLAAGASRKSFKSEQYRNSIVTYFNSLGTEGGFHRTQLDDENTPAYSELDTIIAWAYANGVSKNIRGHALMWDVAEDSARIQIYKDILHDKVALQQSIKNHIIYMAKRFPRVTDWDVSNEDSSRKNFPALNTFKRLYGDTILVDWYQCARKALPQAKLALTDGFDSSSALFKQAQKPFLDWAVTNLTFDVIGQQGHVGYDKTPENIIKTMAELARYGKTVRVTEFDTGTIADDVNYQANIVRDAMIAYFSDESVDTLQLWGHRDHSPTEKSSRIMFFYDWKMKPAGYVYEDLVYNKWWTRDTGKTDTKGNYTTRGYYGDYTITVTKNGKTKTVDVPCRKGKNNTIIITL
ncbi:MAG: hypothetical protein A2096_01710 [Spirochaetes bacterium GWF1_41_5]|nr:MAG: hypothetical protein A2096_01710 [Spirochaetes bacterium GWF1_41_5]HBE00899.1 hypothetical protein [Spirochaetia bacterium]